ALLLCGAIVVALTARQQTPVEQPPAAGATSAGPIPAEARSPRNANYEIDARLDEDAKTIHGKETIHWRNITDEATTELQFHLYWNAWRDAESTWIRERRLGGNTHTPRSDAWGSIDIQRLRVVAPGRVDEATPRLHFIAPDDGNTA